VMPVGGRARSYAADTPRFEVVGAVNDFSLATDFGSIRNLSRRVGVRGEEVNSWIGIGASRRDQAPADCQRGPFASQVFATGSHIGSSATWRTQDRLSRSFLVTPFAQVLFGWNSQEGTDSTGVDYGVHYQPRRGIDVRVAPNVGRPAPG